jgi:hypothetical protein
VLPLLWLLKEGTVSGQEAAARALGQLARDQEQVKAMRDVGACAVFTHILGNHATSMKVQEVELGEGMLAQQTLISEWMTSTRKWEKNKCLFSMA